MTFALSVRQPYAWAIIHAGKDIENRDWRPSNPGLRFRGKCLIHASSGMTFAEYQDAAEAIRDCLFPAYPAQIPGFSELERGGIIGECEIVDCVAESNSRWFFGPYGFVLRHPKPLPFREYKGRLGFFKVPD